MARWPNRQIAPAVTVFMPVYNGARHLQQAIGSILDQTFTNFEFIVIDDGSEDSTPALLRDLAGRDTRIVVITTPHLGQSLASNVGVARARAPILARMDADDIALPMRLELQVVYLRAHPECVLVGSRVECIDVHGAVLPPASDISVKLTHAEIHEALLGRGWPIVHPSVAMRTHAVRRIGGYDPHFRISADHDLFLRLSEHGVLSNLDAVLLYYRRHSASIQGNPANAGLGSAFVQEAIRNAHLRRAARSSKRPVWLDRKRLLLAFSQLASKCERRFRRA